MSSAVIGLLVGCLFGFLVRLPGFALIMAAILIIFGIAQFSAAHSVWSYAWIMLLMLLALQTGYLVGATCYTLIIHFLGIFGRGRARDDLIVRDRSSEGPNILR